MAHSSSLSRTLVALTLGLAACTRTGTPVTGPAPLPVPATAPPPVPAPAPLPVPAPTEPPRCDDHSLWLADPGDHPQALPPPVPGLELRLLASTPLARGRAALFSCEEASAGAESPEARAQWLVVSRPGERFAMEVGAGGCCGERWWDAPELTAVDVDGDGRPEVRLRGLMQEASDGHSLGDPDAADLTPALAELYVFPDAVDPMKPLPSCGRAHLRDRQGAFWVFPKVRQFSIEGDQPAMALRGEMRLHQAGPGELRVHERWTALPDPDDTPFRPLVFTLERHIRWNPAERRLEVSCPDGPWPPYEEPGSAAP